MIQNSSSEESTQIPPKITGKAIRLTNIVVDVQFPQESTPAKFNKILIKTELTNNRSK